MVVLLSGHGVWQAHQLRADVGFHVARQSAKLKDDLDNCVDDRVNMCKLKEEKAPGGGSCSQLSPLTSLTQTQICER